jgi:hypothetical protein
MDDKLVKSIDALIDEMFEKAIAEPIEEIEKANPLDIAKDADTKADAVLAKCPNCGKELHPVKEIAKLDKEKGNYDKDISAPMPMAEPAEKVKMPAPLNKAEMEELEAFRAEKLAKAEEMRKNEVEANQEALIKSIVDRTAEKYEAKIAELQKSMKESADLVKAVANAPRSPKSITSVSALEKSMSPDDKPQSFSKAEMLDKAEELFRKGELKDDEVIELENNGFIYNATSRAKLEKALLD